MPDEIKLTKPISLSQVQGTDQQVEQGVSVNLEPVQLSSPISMQSLSPNQFGETPTTPPEYDEGSVASWQRSMGNIYSGLGGMFHWMDQVGVNISRAMGTPEEDINKARDIVPWKPIAEYFNKKAEQKFAEAEPPKDLGPIKNIWDILDADRAKRMLVEQGPQSALMMASMLLNPTLGTVYMSGVGAGSIQNAADEIERKTGKQLDPIHKVVATSLGGAFEAALEKIGFESAFKTAGAMPLKQRLLKAVVGVATEAGTEGLQEVNQMLAEASFTGEVPEGAARRLVDATYGGMVLGFGANLVTGTFGAVGESEVVKPLPEPTNIDLYRQAIEQNNTPEAIRLEQELTNERLAHPVIQEDGSIKWEELSNEELEVIILNKGVKAFEKIDLEFEEYNPEKFYLGDKSILESITAEARGDITTGLFNNKSIIKINYKDRTYTSTESTNIHSYFENNLNKSWNKQSSILWSAIKKSVPSDAVFNSIYDKTAKFAGLYDPSSGGIFINEDLIVIESERPQIILHEILHSITKGILTRALRLFTPEQFAKQWDTTLDDPFINRYSDWYNSPLAKKEIEFIDALKKLQKYVLKNIPKDFYKFEIAKSTLTDIEEFFSYSLTDVGLMAQLKKINYTASETVWTKFLDALKNLFGLENTTALDELFNITSKYLFETTSSIGKEVPTRILGEGGIKAREIQVSQEQQFLDWARTQIDQHELLKDYIEQGRVPENHLPTQNPGGEIQEDILGKETDDGIPAVRYNPPKFIKWIQQRAMFPEFVLFKKGKEIARKMSALIITTEQAMHHIVKDYEQWYKKLKHGLSDEELMLTHKAVELARQSHNPDTALTTRINAENELAQLFAKHPMLEKAVLGVDNRGGLIQLFEFVKKRYQNMLVERKKIELGDQYDLVNTLVEQERAPGMKSVMFERATKLVREKLDIEAIAKDRFNKKNKSESWDTLSDKLKQNQITATIRGLATKLSNDADQILAIDKWGLKDYVTNIELGSYRIFDENGNTVGFERTAKDAKRRAFDLRKKLKEEGKTAPKYEVEATFSPIKPTAHRGYWAIVDADGNTVKEIDVHEPPKKYFAMFKKGLKEQGKSVAGYSLQKVDVLKGMDNLFEVLPRYVYAMEKRIHFEPIKDQFKKEKKLYKDEYTADVNAMIQNQLDYVTGAKYSRVDMIVDEYAQAFGWKTGLFSKAVTKIRQGTALVLLGYRQSASAINAMTGFGNTWVSVGNQIFAKASEVIKTGKYIDRRGNEIDMQRLLKEIEDKGQLGIDFAVSSEGEISPRATIWEPLGKLGRWLHPMYTFTLPEKYIRPHSFVANYIYEMEVAGKDHFEAQEAALMNLRFQQGVYGLAAIPQMMRSAEGKLVFQFKSFIATQLQFMSTLRGKQIPRMIGLQLAMAGPRGAVYMLKSLPILGALGLLDDLEEWLVKKEESPVQGFLKRGVGGLVGGDISAPATFQLPNKPEDWAGPFLSKAYKLFGDVIFPGVQSVVGKITGHPAPAYVTDEGIDWVNSLSPMMTYVDDLLDSVLSWESDIEVEDLQSGYRFLSDKLQRPNIWIRDSQGNKAYQIGGLQDRILLALGIQPVSKSQYSTIKRIWERNSKISDENRRKWFARVSKRLIDGKPLDADLIQDGILYQVDMGQIPDSYSFRQMAPQQRETLRARLMDKAEAFDTFNLK